MPAFLFHHSICRRVHSVSNYFSSPFPHDISSLCENFSRGAVRMFGYEEFFLLKGLK